MNINRRRMLISGATALMLPNLEANLFAGGASGTAPVIPKRLVFLAMGYGGQRSKLVPVNKPNRKEVRSPATVRIL